MIQGNEQKTIVSGKEWHKDCYDSTKQQKTVTSGVNNTESCPLCQKPVPTSDMIVVSGKEWHKSCFDSLKQ